MGLPLLLPLPLPLLLLPASLQAGEWPELSCSARDPREELWLGVCRRVPWGSWPGLPPPTNKRRVPQCWVPQPLTLLPAPSLATLSLALYLPWPNSGSNTVHIATPCHSLGPSVLALQKILGFPFLSKL